MLKRRRRRKSGTAEQPHVHGAHEGWLFLISLFPSSIYIKGTASPFKELLRRRISWPLPFFFLSPREKRIKKSRWTTYVHDFITSCVCIIYFACQSKKKRQHARKRERDTAPSDAVAEPQPRFPCTTSRLQPIDTQRLEYKKKRSQQERESGLSC